MTYTSVNQLPRNVKSLSNQKQKQWLAVFNSALDKGASEESATEQAWLSVRKAKENSFLMIKETINYDVPFVVSESFSSSNKQSLTIVGTAINVTITRNNVEYLAEELEKAADTLVGKNIFMAHNTNPSESVGKITEAFFDGKSIPFKAEIFNTSTYPDMHERIKNGLIQHVSIGAGVEEIEEYETEEGLVVRRAKGINFDELSFVGVPGDRNATFTHALAEKFEGGKHILKEEVIEKPKEKADVNQNKENKKIGEVKMEPENKENNKNEEVLKENKKLLEEVKLLREQLEKIHNSQKEEIIEEMKEFGMEVKEDFISKDIDVLKEMLNFAKKVSEEVVSTKTIVEQTDSEEKTQAPSEEEKAEESRKELGYKIVKENGKIFGVPLGSRGSIL